MSSEEISAPKVDVKALADSLFFGIKPKLQVVVDRDVLSSKDLFLSFANEFVSNIVNYARQGLDSNELIEYLGQITGYGYGAIKSDWDRLTEGQKKEVIDLLTSKIAEEGLNHLFGSIVKEFTSRWALLYPSEEIREKEKAEGNRIIKAAKDYLDGKISFFDMAVELAKVFWPPTEYFIELKKMEKEGIKDPFKYYELRNQVGRAYELNLRNYFNGVELANYISGRKLKKLVREYLINDISKFIA